MSPMEKLITLAVAQAPTPTLLVHADWSTHPGKRWMARASRDGQTWRVAPPEPAPHTGNVGHLVGDRTQSGAVVGFDFPIGVPRAYAARARIDSFRDLLPRLGYGEWSEFFSVARTASDISLHRPFYPFSPGGKKSPHLVEALGLAAPSELFRCCEEAQPHLGPASPLFWTLGAKQV